MINKVIASANCRAMIIGIPTIKLACFVLWRIISIVASINTEPPRMAVKNSLASGTLFCGFFLAARLSRTVIMTATNDIAIR